MYCYWPHFFDSHFLSSSHEQPSKHTYTHPYPHTFIQVQCQFSENIWYGCTFLATTDSFVWPTHENRTWMWMSLLCILIIIFFLSVSAALCEHGFPQKITLFHWYMKRRYFFGINFSLNNWKFSRSYISIRSHRSLYWSLLSKFDNYEIHRRFFLMMKVFLVNNEINSFFDFFFLQFSG